ncbi:MAG TPA: hypothetical protein VKA55_10835 [Gammaproteobacteria bacterium]|nr:hypothetical protein [Gammaproteobacteria bacterium]
MTDSKRPNPTLRFAVGATIAGGLAIMPAVALADGNPFQAQDLGSGYMVADNSGHNDTNGMGDDDSGMGMEADKGKEGNCSGSSGAEEDGKDPSSHDGGKSDKKDSEGVCASG